MVSDHPLYLQAIRLLVPIEGQGVIQSVRTWPAGTIGTVIEVYQCDDGRIELDIELEGNLDGDLAYAGVDQVEVLLPVISLTPPS